MKRKIGIITIIDQLNYGNRLQNYAMQIFLSDFDFEVETIRFSSLSPRTELITRLKASLLSNDAIVGLRNRIKREQLQLDKKKILAQNEKRKAFQKFTNKYIRFANFVIRENKIPKKQEQRYQYFVVGSDQIWNPTYKHFEPYITYLRFTEERKRIAVSPSFGVDFIPEELRKQLTQYLNEMHYLSVRERSGAEIVEKLTGRNCDVLLDPTMLVSLDSWKNLVNNTQLEMPPKYVLTYFLGQISQERRTYIEHYAAMHNAEIVEMNCLEKKEIYSWGPDKFLKAIQNSEMFFTDSFHGCVFSMIFHKQFAVFRRMDKQADMFSRVDTLLNSMELSECVVNDLTSEPYLISEEKYQKVDDTISREKQRTKSILEIIFSQKGDKNED